MFTISFITDNTFERVAHMTGPDKDMMQRALEALCAQEGSFIPGGLLWEGGWADPSSKAIERYSPTLGWLPY